MNGPNAGAGEHGKGSLGNHRHVNDDTVALGDALFKQDVSQRLNFGEQVLIGDNPFGSGNGAVINDGGLSGPAPFHMAVNAVIAGIAGCALEPPSGDTRGG